MCAGIVSHGLQVHSVWPQDTSATILDLYHGVVADTSLRVSLHILEPPYVCDIMADQWLTRLRIILRSVSQTFPFQS
jgi:hypothetical protein